MRPKSWVDLICAQRSNAASDASDGTAGPAMNAFPFSLVRAIFRSVVEAGMISIAGLALILQYGYRALQVASFSGNEFLDRVFPVTEKVRGQ
jgi:hypothetical protein